MAIGTSPLGSSGLPCYSLCRGLWTKVYPCFSRKGRIKKSCREEFDTAAFRVRLQKGREREREEGHFVGVSYTKTSAGSVGW